MRCLIFVLCYITGWSLYRQFGLSTSSPSPEYGVISSSSTRFAYATLLTSEDAEYFTATRVLLYQLLHDPETRSNDTSIPFVIMVTKAVPASQRQQLVSEGATVILVEDVPLPFWIRQRLKKPNRYKDQFTKLRILQMLEYDRVLYLDADTLLMRPIDGAFHDPAVVHPWNTSFAHATEHPFGLDVAVPPPAQYVFAARPDNGILNDDIQAGGYEHPIPPIEHDALNAGFWIAAPSNELFDYYMAVITSSTTGIIRPFDPQFMEQAMLNYVHTRAHGCMPWKSLDWKWSATYANKGDVNAGVASLHDKFWLQGLQAGRERWQAKFKEMEGWSKDISR